MICTGKYTRNNITASITHSYNTHCFLIFTEEAVPLEENLPTNTSCVNWNQYYSKCEQRALNPFQGTISFDNIGMAWVAIFLVSIVYRFCFFFNKI